MKKGNRRSKSSLLKGTRGAVLAEFIIAFMPIMTIYLTMLELAHYFVIREVVVHAANATARACAVVGPNDAPVGGGKNGGIADAQAAGEWALKPWKASGNNVQNIKVECTQADPAQDPAGKTSGHITADYSCSVPIAKLIACAGGPKKIDVTSSFPHQGAKYK